MPFFGPSVWSDRGRVRDSGRYSRRGRIEDAKRLSVRLYTRHCECARVVRLAVRFCRSMQYRAVMHIVGIVARCDLAAVQGHFLKFWGIAGGAKMTVSGTLARRLGVRWMQIESHGQGDEQRQHIGRHSRPSQQTFNQTDNRQNWDPYCRYCQTEFPSLRDDGFSRSEVNTSELQSLMRISYAVFCLKKKNHSNN